MILGGFALFCVKEYILKDILCVNKYNIIVLFLLNTFFDIDLDRYLNQILLKSLWVGRIGKVG